MQLTWSVHRRATTEDRNRLNAASDRFTARYGVTPGEVYSGRQSDTVVARGITRNCRELTGAYDKAVHRALRDTRADGIQYDTVGHWVED